MAEALTDVLRYICRLANDERSNEQSDGDLLQQFVAKRDEGAFARILQRHGPLVFGVCRQLSCDAHDAEDAFQATFLVLARKAMSIHKQSSLAAWLCRVAVNIARTARTSASQRRKHERQAFRMSQSSPIKEAPVRDWQPLLHEEVDRLPEKYRLPVVLCYLKGNTHDEAARQLGWPLGSVKGRLARARDLLRTRLARRGLTLSGGGLAAALTQSTAMSQVPPALLGHTLRVALSFAASKAIPAGAISGQALALAKGALQTVSTTKLVSMLVVTFVIGAVCFAAALGPDTGGDAKLDGPPAAKGDLPEKKGAPVEDDMKQLQGTWRLVAMEQGGKAVDPENFGQSTRWTFSGTKGSWRSGLRGLNGNIAIDPAKNPKRIDVNRQNGLMLHGLYELKGDTLRLFLVSPEEERPKEFKIREGAQQIFVESPGHANLGGQAIHTYQRVMREDGQVIQVTLGSVRPEYRLGEAVDLTLTIKNNGKEEFSYLKDKLRELNGFQITGPDGKEVKYKDVPAEFGGPATFVTVKPGEAVTIKDILRHINLGINISKVPGGEAYLRHMYYPMEALGVYRLRMRVGEASSNELKVKIVGKVVERQETAALKEARERLENTVKEDLKKLEGTWHMVGCEEGGKVFTPEKVNPNDFLTLSGTKFYFKSDQRRLKGDFTIDPSKNPKWMDQIAVGGKPVFKGIYEFEGEKLLVFFGAPEGERPNQFKTKAGEKTWLRTYERVKASGHTREVGGVALSADGKHVLTGSSNAILWTADPARPLRTFQGHTHWVVSVALSADGKHVATGSHDQTAILWDAATGRILQTFEDHTAEVSGVALSADGKRLLTGSWDDTAILWDTATGKKLQTFRGHRGIVTSVALSADGTKVVTTSTDKTAILWDTATGNKLQTFQGHASVVFSVALSSDTKHVVTGSEDRTAILWEASTGKPLQTFQGHAADVHSVALSADGKQVLTGSRDKTAILWESASGKKLQTFQGHDGELSSVALSADGKLVVTGSYDNTAILWDAATGKKLQTFSRHTKS
jgi:RNA polymerase sigma factor (sigma-70 family)